MSFRKNFPLLLVSIVLLTLIGCAGRQDENEPQRRTIKVFAASSMTDAMKDIEESYEALHPEIDIMINFAGSKTLRSQIENGAQADLFISANEKHYMALNDMAMFSKGQALLYNEMVVVVSNRCDVDIQSLQDLKKPLKLVLAEKAVPAGDYARKVFQNYTLAEDAEFYDLVMGNVVSEETNVRQVLMKAALGEADAAIVYKTDVTKAVADQVKMVEIPDGYNVKGTYYLGMLADATNEASKLYDFISGDEGAEVFESYGFDQVK